MSASRNLVILMGHLGADPELKYLPSGQAVCEIRIATTERWTDKSGEKQERTEWHRIVAWGKTGENVAQYMKKGGAVFVEGKLQTRSWDDRDGNKRYMTEVVADRVQFLGGGSGSGAGGSEDHEPEQQSFGGGGAGGGAPSNVTNFPPYGRSKGEPIRGASAETLEFYANGCRRSLADASKSKWHAKEKALLMAIEAEIERQRRGGSATPAGTRAAMDAAGGGQGFGGSGPTEWTGGDGSPDDDVPFITSDGIR